MRSHAANSMRWNPRTLLDIQLLIALLCDAIIDYIANNMIGCVRDYVFM